MKLSPREYQVAELIAWGASDKEVADELSISVLTARTHRRNILGKIRGHNAADLTRWFFEMKAKQSFGLNPRQVRHITWILLILLGVGEIFTSTDMIRVRRVRGRRSNTIQVRNPLRVRRGKTLAVAC